MSLLKLENLSATYGDFWAVQNANLEVKSGEILGLLGVSGSGKTSILRMTAGLEASSTGKIIFDNQDMRHYRR